MIQTNSEPDNYIAGTWVKGDGVSFTSIDPATGKTIWRGNAVSPAQVITSVQAARAAFAPWMILDLNTRIEYLAKFVQNLEKNKDDLALTLSKENGKPLWEAKTEIAAMIGKLEISKQAFAERCKLESKDLQGITSVTRHKPHGVVVVLGPFNFPGHLPNGHIIPALLAGNTVIFKPSELTPYFSCKFMQCWETAGLPIGVINMVQGPSEVGRALVENPDIDGVFFTGSSATGQKIQASSLEHPGRILALEMGGNNPLVVYQPDNIDAAVYNTIQSAFITSGQRCSCARRLIVYKDASGENFVQRLLEVTRNLKVGTYKDNPEPFMGPVISNAAADHILNAYQKLVGLGAKVLVPISRPNPDVAVLTPGIVDATGISELPDEEIFGPLLILQWVESFPAAIDAANKTAYGLTAGIFTSQQELYIQFLQQVRAGVINWNRPLTGASSAAPFGGLGKSGNNRPSAYYAADYCAYPVASMEQNCLQLPPTLSPGIKL